jgi:hypothetical protein
MKTIDETKDIFQKAMQLNENTLKDLMKYLTENDFVYAVCEEPDDFKILSKSYGQ